jgi:hypothetical protein
MSRCDSRIKRQAITGTVSRCGRWEANRVNATCEEYDFFDPHRLYLYN